MPCRLLVIGLDAAEPGLIERWAADGTLPAVRAVLAGGTSGPLRGVEGFHVGSTWPSLSTGLDPAGHGFHRIDQLAPGTYDFVRPLDSPDGIGGVPFWRAASDAGRRVAVLDVPLTRPEPGLNGLQIVEWGGHDSVFGFRTSPPALRDEVLAGVGAYPLPSDCDAHRETARDFDRFVSGLELAAARKTALTLDVLAREDWDLVVQVFSESHCAGHQCWHLHDPAHPSHDRQLRDALGDPLERVYRAIDAGVGAIVAQAAATHVLLFSSHGMGGFHGVDFLFPEILYRLGATARPAPSPLQVRAARQVRTRLARTPLRRAVHRARGHLPRRGQSHPRSLDHWADTAASRCFPVPNGVPVSAVRLNLAGREPHGVLKDGPEAERFCDKLTHDLAEIVDEATGAPLVAAVHRTDSLYSGPRRDSLPDLLVEWNGTVLGTLAHADGRGSTVRASSAKIGLVEGHNATLRTGDHHPDGLYALTGPGIPHASGEPGRLVDIHPTICRLLDVPAPRVDGEVIPAVAGL